MSTIDSTQLPTSPTHSPVEDSCPTPANADRRFASDLELRSMGYDLLDARRLRGHPEADVVVWDVDLLGPVGECVTVQITMLGSAVDEVPDLTSAIEVLYMDAGWARLSYSGFCSFSSVDPRSGEARAAYRACQRAAANLKRLAGPRSPGVAAALGCF